MAYPPAFTACHGVTGHEIDAFREKSGNGRRRISFDTGYVRQDRPRCKEGFILCQEPYHHIGGRTKDDQIRLLQCLTASRIDFIDHAFLLSLLEGIFYRDRWR